jgi:hypothetical protein
MSASLAVEMRSLFERRRLTEEDPGSWRVGVPDFGPAQKLEGYSMLSPSRPGWDADSGGTRKVAGPIRW